MRKSKLLIVAIILMAVGFAVVTTNLVINGKAVIGNNVNDYEIRFTRAILDGIENNSLIIEDGKKISYETKKLINVGDTSELVYEITNNSSQYDAEVSITCTPTGTDTHTNLYTINTKDTPDKIEAKRSETGSIEISLTNLATEEIREAFVCTLNITAMEKTTIGESCPYEKGHEWTFDYIGSEDEFIVPCTGQYKLEVWGAQGGTRTDAQNGGYGAYASGFIDLEEENNLYINVGGEGNHLKGGYNGGNDGVEGSGQYGAGSGGATSIAITSGLLSTLKNDINNILIVAAGGGGTGLSPVGNYVGLGGSGGGYVGVNGIDSSSYNSYYGTGATQTSGGKSYSGSSSG